MDFIIRVLVLLCNDQYLKSRWDKVNNRRDEQGERDCAQS